MRVEGDETGLRYEHRPTGGEAETRTVMSSEAAWRRFAGELDRLGVWDWERWYPSPPGITDGASWAIRIDDGKRAVVSEGSNGAPSQFNALTDAIEELIGAEFQ
jgi:hypothetical protein